MPPPFPFFYRFILRNPGRVQYHLEELSKAGRIDAVPTLWQTSLGVFYMVHRLLFRPETVGLGDAPVRNTWGARLFTYRPIRFPFLMALKAIDPIDLTGLSGSVERKLSHLVGAYHQGDHALYDLECLSWNEPALRKLRADLSTILEEKTFRSKFLLDLCVYEGYHANLLRLVDKALGGDFEAPFHEASDPDANLRAFLGWCAAAPETPEATLASLLRGHSLFATTPA